MLWVKPPHRGDGAPESIVWQHPISAQKPFNSCNIYTPTVQPSPTKFGDKHSQMINSPTLIPRWRGSRVIIWDMPCKEAYLVN